MKCSQCIEDAFLFCNLCKQYFCNEHKCLHLGAFIDNYAEDQRIEETTNGEIYDRGIYGRIQTENRHWLSYDNILGSMPSDKIKEAISRYKILIQKLEQELMARSLSNVQYNVQVLSMDKRYIPQAVKQKSRSILKINKISKVITRSGLLKQVIEYLQKRS